MATESRIAIHVSNQRAYVWNVDGAYIYRLRGILLIFFALDISTLRSKHHICGILTGTLPHVSQQNVFLGIPLVLMPEEAVLLVENGEIHDIRTFFDS